MICLMAMQRITITVDEHVVQELRDRVEAGEVSAYIVEALRHKLRIDPVNEMLQQLDTLHGPLDERAMAEGAQWFEQMMQRLSSTPEP
jgi:Arc/MetJ-type ribon-helix-helix transcriptional regulator